MASQITGSGSKHWDPTARLGNSCFYLTPLYQKLRSEEGGKNQKTGCGFEGGAQLAAIV